MPGCGEAEREAREYLEHAKRRADSLVNTMVGAVEREAAEMRREAEDGIRIRWQQAEVDAERHVEEARRVAERIVAERQQRIAALSDGIARSARALYRRDGRRRAGAGSVRRVRPRSGETADRIAPPGTAAFRGRRRAARPGRPERGRRLDVPISPGRRGAGAGVRRR